jgi:hypothetical protein
MRRKGILKTIFYRRCTGMNGMGVDEQMVVKKLTFRGDESWKFFLNFSNYFFEARNSADSGW